MVKITAKIPTKSRILGKINAGTTLDKIIDKKGGMEAMAKHGVPCISCPMAQFEIDKLEIGEVCKMYGLNLKGILADLNKTKVKKTKSKKKPKSS